MLLAFLMLSACSYRFTNEHVVRPEGIQSIAVEAVFDTSREVLPHEEFWGALQAAFAANGHLQVLPQGDADALVRAHIRQADIRHIGSTRPNGPVDDPKIFDGEPAAPKSFKPLTQAGEVRDEGMVSASVQVEVWNLRTRSLVMQRTYALKSKFRTVHALRSGGATTAANDYLRYEESADAKFAGLADDLSRRVVQDLLIK